MNTIRDLFWVNSYLASSEKVPAQYVGAPHATWGRELISAWGAPMYWLQVSGGGNIMQMEFNMLDVPLEACTRLLVTDADGSSGFFDGIVSAGGASPGTNQAPPITPSDAARLCNSIPITDPTVGRHVRWIMNVEQ